MTIPYVKRQDISVTEEREEEPTFSGPIVTTTWTANLSGRFSIGEHIDMERSGDTYAEALYTLENAIAGLGWEVRG